MSGDAPNWTWAEAFTAVSITLLICVAVVSVVWIYCRSFGDWND